MNNKYIVLASMASVIMGFSSCSNFLDELPDNRTELSELNVSKLLLAAYPTTSISEIGEMSSDNTDAYPNRFSSFNRLQEDLYKWADSSEKEEDSPSALWESCYLAVSACNQVLATIEKAGNPSAMNPQRGEALVCRAYNHFLLANVFCNAYSTKAGSDLGIPYMKTIETTVSPEYQRGTLEEVYKNIEADLLEGAKLVSDNVYKVPKYHFTIKAANAFAARFYLYYVQPDKSNYQKVIDYATKVLGSDARAAMRDWRYLGALDANGDLQPNEYVNANNSANLLLVGAHSYFGYVNGPYGLGERYNHGFRLAGETCNSNGPWGNYDPNKVLSIYHTAMWSNSSALPTKCMLRKIAIYKNVVDAAGGIINGYMINASFTTDETLLTRAEAYAMKGQYTEAVADLNAWQSAYTRSTTPLTVESITAFYQEMAFYTPNDPTCKKELCPDFAIENGTQLNLIHCILHVRRMLTLHEGLRWFDVKRYGIEIYRRFMNDNGTVTVTDKLDVTDPRRAIQIPSDVILAGMQPNPRNK